MSRIFSLSFVLLLTINLQAWAVAQDGSASNPENAQRAQSAGEEEVKRSETKRPTEATESGQSDQQQSDPKSAGDWLPKMEAGGDTHQQADGDLPPLTTQQGVVVGDDQNSLKIGPRGPVLLEDFHLREKLFHFDHERIPERVVHARGFGVHGYFENYKSLSSITKADLFQEAGQKTPAFVRFSTVAGSKGSPDVARDVRGFAVKLYTQAGNWDLVGNNIPVFFIQDAIKFPDLIHAVKPAPDRGFPQAQTAHDNFWDFISLTPESMHMVMWIMSDRTIPRSFRFMEGFGVHSFRFVNADGKSTYVKFHWKPKQGLQSVLWDEAVKINGADPDYHRRDLWSAIESGNHPEWELGVQLFDDEFADEFEFDILDATKIIPEELVPIKPIGRLVLDRRVDNFFAETEQVAFCTQKVVPGIDFTNDPLLQGRNFSYLDTQLKRLGSPNFTHLPINAPQCPVHNFQQDGHMAMRNPQGRVNYEPNSWGKGPRESANKGFHSLPVEESGEKRRVRAESFADHYSQARQFYISQTPIEQNHIVNALTFELSKVEKAEIRVRMVSHLLNIDKQLAEQAAEGLGLTEMPAPAKAAKEPITDLPPSPALSIIKNGPESFAGRTVAVVVTDGVDGQMLAKVKEAVQAEGAMMKILAPHIDGIHTSDDEELTVNETIAGGPSVLFDAVILLTTSEGAKQLKQNRATHEFVADALAHRKFIGYTETELLWLEQADELKQHSDQLIRLDQNNGVETFIKRCRELRAWEGGKEDGSSAEED